MRYLSDQKGQALIEFILSLTVLLIFIYGLISCTMWSAAGFCAQKIAHESARKYAVTLDKTKAETQGKNYLGQVAYIFIEPSGTNVEVWRNGTDANSRVSVKPRIGKLYIFEMPKITRTSRATLEDVFRNPQNYNT